MELKIISWRSILVFVSDPQKKRFKVMLKKIKKLKLKMDIKEMVVADDSYGIEKTFCAELYLGRKRFLVHKVTFSGNSRRERLAEDFIAELIADINSNF